MSLASDSSDASLGCANPDWTDPVPASPSPGLPSQSLSPATAPALAALPADPAPSTAGDAALLPSPAPPTVAPVAPKSPAMSTLAALAETLSQLQAANAPENQVHAVINSIAQLVAQTSPVPPPNALAVSLQSPPPPRGSTGLAAPAAAPAIPSSPATPEKVQVFDGNPTAKAPAPPPKAAAVFTRPGHVANSNSHPVEWRKFERFCQSSNGATELKKAWA